MPIKNRDLEKTPFIEDIRDDLINNEQGKFILATGQPGSGKSMAMARLAEKVDDDFSIERIAIGKITPFIGLLQQALDGKLPHGSCILADEAGVFISAREWQTSQNRILSLIFQTIRKLGILVLMTVPAKRMIDIHGQILMKYYGTGRYIDYKKKRSIFSFYAIKYNDWEDMLTRHLLRDENGEKVNLWELALPNKCLDFEEYEKKKDEMLGELFERARKVFTKIESEDNNGDKKGKGKRELLYPKVPIIMDKFGVSKYKACNILGVSHGDYGSWEMTHLSPPPVPAT